MFESGLKYGVQTLPHFGLKKGKDFDHFDLKKGVSFTQAWCWVFCLQGFKFFHLNIGKRLALLKCLLLHKWKPFLVSCGHYI